MLPRHRPPPQPVGGRAVFNATDLAEQMDGRAGLSDRAAAWSTRSPSAYKDIDQVMAARSDLVEVEHTLRQDVSYKGV